MIERQIVAQKLKEREIEGFIFSSLGKLSCSRIKMQRTPLGEKITIYTSRPGLIVGRRGVNIKVLTSTLKEKFGLENPQLEVVEIENPRLNALTVAKELVAGIERFGPKRFKVMAYKALEGTMDAGAVGIEIIISGRGIPGERAKSWRFASGYMKKSGDVSLNKVDRAFESCDLKSGTIGIKVSILGSDILLPDTIKEKEGKEVVAEDKEKKKIEVAKEEQIVDEVTKTSEAVKAGDDGSAKKKRERAGNKGRKNKKVDNIEKDAGAEGVSSDDKKE